MCERCYRFERQQAGQEPKDIAYFIDQGAKSFAGGIGILFVVCTSPLWVPIYLLGRLTDKRQKRS